MLIGLWTRKWYLTNFTHVIHLYLRRDYAITEIFLVHNFQNYYFTPELLLIFNSLDWVTHHDTILLRKMWQYFKIVAEKMKNKNILVITVAEKLSTMPFTSLTTTEMGMSWKCEWGKWKENKNQCIKQETSLQLLVGKMTSHERVLQKRISWEFTKCRQNRITSTQNSCRAKNSISIFANICDFFEWNIPPNYIFK